MAKPPPDVPWQPPNPSCRPPPGKTFLTIGQDFFSIQEYILSQYNASLEDGSTKPLKSFAPAATMFYTDIQELRGLASPVDYGSGIEDASALKEAFPKSGIQIGLWLNGTEGCQDIVDGNLDLQISEMFKLLQKLYVPKVFLRVGYEFDNPWFGYSSDPLVYQQAFRKMVNACELQLSIPGCHRVVSFVWHSWAAPKVAPLEAFYPGDEYVDWVGISIFQQLYPWANLNSTGANHDFAGGTLDQVKDVLEFAQAHDKPVMIAESTPFGGMTFEDQPPPDIDFDWKTKEGDPIEKDIWDLWFQPTLDLIEEYDIRMWSYINCDWNSQPMWAGVGFGDTRIASSANVMAKWRQQVLGDGSRFVTKIDCWANNHSSFKKQYAHTYHATPFTAFTTGTSASLYNFDSFSMILPGIVVAAILCLIVWGILKVFVKDQMEEPEQAATLLKEEAKQDYGAVSSAVQETGNRFSVNL